MKKRVLVVEDDPVLTRVLCDNLTFEGFDVQATADGAQAQSMARDFGPDLVLLDVNLPGRSGFELCEAWRQRSQVPIILLTAMGQKGDKIRGLQLGADDYVTKPFSPRELNARVKAVLRRRAPQVTDDVVRLGGLDLDPASHRVSGNGQPIELGPTEFRLLHFLMTHAERVHSRAQLLDQVWGDHVFVEERTVDVHIRRLRKALEPTALDNLVQTVRGTGYRMSATP